MKIKEIAVLSSCIVVFLIGLSGCDSPYATKTSFTDDDVSDYYDNQMQVAKKNVPELMNKYDQVIKSISNLEYTELDTTNKLVVDVPVFGGSSDSCRYNPDALVTYFTLYDLDSTIENPMEDVYSPMGFELRALLKTAMSIDGNRPGQYTGSNKSKVTKICEELHNLKVLWESKYVFILEIDEYEQVPYRPYGKSQKGSSLKANWHVFDFSEVRYLGSIPFEVNNDGFQSKNSETVTTEKTVTKRNLLPSVAPTGRSQYLTETETVSETTERSLSLKDKRNQADYDFSKKYTETAGNAVRKYVLNANKKFANLVTLR